jgi:hypothetical protein
LPPEAKISVLQPTQNPKMDKNYDLRPETIRNLIYNKDDFDSMNSHSSGEIEFED